MFQARNPRVESEEKVRKTDLVLVYESLAALLDLSQREFPYLTNEYDQHGKKIKERIRELRDPNRIEISDECEEAFRAANINIQRPKP